MGFLLENAMEDVRSVLADGDEWSIPLIFTPSTGEEITVNGLAFVHSQNYDSDFRPVIAENSHITFVEKDLGVNVRSGNKVTMQGWIVEFTLNTVEYKCIVGACEPDTTLGLIKAQLTNYVNN
jgi:hypothetical protein